MKKQNFFFSQRPEKYFNGKKKFHSQFLCNSKSVRLLKKKKRQQFLLVETQSNTFFI